MISFAVQKLLSLIKSYLFIFAFISIALGDWSMQMLLWFMSDIVIIFNLNSQMVYKESIKIEKCPLDLHFFLFSFFHVD